MQEKSLGNSTFKKKKLLKLLQYWCLKKYIFFGPSLFITPGRARVSGSRHDACAVELLGTKCYYAD